ncbi:MAG: flavin reductase family protein [Phycisphaeraceae bacterium]
MDEKKLAGIAAAMGRIPQGLFVLTARHEDRRTGILVSWVQQVCFSPPMVAVSVAKGRPIMPLISESRAFGLCQLYEGERTIFRKFASGTPDNEDPFLGLELLPDTYAHVPVLAGSMSYMACEVVRHVDADGDHDMFIGAVRTGNYLQGIPHVHLRDSGLRY